VVVGCGGANVAQEKEALMTVDREWSSSVKDLDKFLSYYAADASVYAPGAPVATGSDAIRKTLTPMLSSPGFDLAITPVRSEVSASGDVGYTSGTYQATMNGGTEKGKYISVWKKQSDGRWKVVEDIFNADSGPPPTAHVIAEAASLKWGDAPPALPPGAKLAVVSGDPSKAEPFTIRAQVPAGYKVPPHWHPGDENLTILSGTVALGMGDAWDEASMKSVGTGGYAGLPAGMHHSFLAKTAATFQVHGMGPFEITYVNAADDPRQKK
jgi:ketosteroid isomerase-like protein